MILIQGHFELNLRIFLSEHCCMFTEQLTLAAELIVLMRFACGCVSQEGVEVRVARIFNTFGSRMHMNDGRVVSNFILQALQGEPLTVRPVNLIKIMNHMQC